MARRRRSFFFDNFNKRLLSDTFKNTKESKDEVDLGITSNTEFATLNLVSQTIERSDIDDLGNVLLTSLADDQILRYDSSTSKWKNETLTLTSSLSALTDTTITSPANNNYLVYNGSEWVNSALDLSSDTTPQLGGNLDVNDNLIYNDTGAVKLRAGTADYVTIVNTAGTDKIRFSDTGGMAALGWYHQFGDSSGDAGTVNIMGSTAGFVTGSGSLKIHDNDSSAHVELTVPTAVSANVTFTLPGADGTNGQVLTTDGAGNLTFTSAGGGGLANIVEDTTPQLGGDLDTNGKKIRPATQFQALNIETYNGTITLDPSYGSTIIKGGIGTFFQADITVYNGITLNSNPTSPGSNGTVIDGLTYPSTDGSNDQVLTTDGSGNLSFADGGDAVYTPTTSTDWNGTTPTTVGEAIDRLAALVKTLNGGTGA